MLKMNLRENLNKKLEKTVLHIAQLKQDKRISNAQFQEQIKSAEKKSNTLAKALETDNETFLVEAFSKNEIDTFSK